MLALIAGQGRLPGLLLTATEAAGKEVLLAALHGAEPSLPRAPEWFRVEQLGSFLARLKAAGVTEVCFAGGLVRPAIDPSQIDAATLPLMERIAFAAAAGDDAALRIVLTIFEEHGFAVLGAHEVVPDLVPDEGIATVVKPDEADASDAARGEAIAAALGRADVGQACVVAGGQALAVEAMPGTAWMLRSLASLRAETGAEGRKGLLFKAPKPGQERRMDLPAIGPDTVEQAEATGLKGIVIEAGGVMVLDLPEVVRRADAAGLFLWVRQSGGAA